MDVGVVVVEKHDVCVSHGVEVFDDLVQVLLSILGVLHGVPLGDNLHR